MNTSSHLCLAQLFLIGDVSAIEHGVSFNTSDYYHLWIGLYFDQGKASCNQIYLFDKSVYCLSHHVDMHTCASIPFNVL
jgi:hypothetical protein